MISVIIPVYQGAAILPTTVPAVLAMNGVGEWIWVDDGSTDATGERLAEFVRDAEDASVLTHPHNRGRAAARNTAIAHARGDLVVMLDADVEPTPDLAVRLAEAARQPGAVAAVARLQPVITDPSDPYQDYVQHHPRGPAETCEPGDPIDWRFFVTAACAVRRESLETLGGFQESIAYGEDLALGCALSQRTPKGLRLAAATAALHDIGGLADAVEAARAFGRGARHIRLECLPWALRVRDAPGTDIAAAAVAAGFSRLCTQLGPGTVRRKAVRYLLGATVLRAAARV